VSSKNPYTSLKAPVTNIKIMATLVSIPTADEINVFNSPDEQVACEHFLGKNLEEAEGLFRQNALLYQEDLMWMGPNAFKFYVKAAIRYVFSRDSVNDSIIIGALTSILEFHIELQWETHSGVLREIAGDILSVCKYIIQNHEKFNLDDGLYSDVCGRLIELSECFRKIDGGDCCEIGVAHSI
jgi:hypothetical protein